MKFILKILFFIPILFISSCEELEDVLPVDTDQFLGTWYANQNMENYMEFTVNRDQSIVPVESLLSGIRALEGGIIVSGSGINDTVNYSSILSEDSDGLMLTNLSFLEFFPLMAYDTYGLPDELILLAISEDSDSLTMIIGENIYVGFANFTWHIDFDDSLALENFLQNSDLTLLSFNGSSSLANVFNPSQTISLSGSIGFYTLDLKANTPIDYMEFSYGLSMAEFLSLLGDGEDDFASDELGLALTINEDSTYTMITAEENSEPWYGIDSTFTIYDTCSGSWTVSNNKIQVDASNQACSDNDDSEDSGTSYSNIEIGLMSNGNLEMNMWSNSFCDLAFEDGDEELDDLLGDGCYGQFEDSYMLEPNSLSSFKLGSSFEFSSIQNENLFFNHKDFQSYLNRNMSKIRASYLKKTQVGILKNIK